MEQRTLLADVEDIQATHNVQPVYQADAPIVLFHGDAALLLEQVPNRSIDLIITSPPYNLGKQYESKVMIDDYLDTQAELIGLMYDKLADTGSICWQVGNYVQNGEVFPLDIFYYP